MTIATLQNVPQSERDWLAFAFANQDHHNLLNQALQAKTGVNNPPTVLDPIAFFDFENWLRRHAQQHLVYDNTLNLFAPDLTALNIRNKEELTSWVFLHYQDHQQAASILGAPQ